MFDLQVLAFQTDLTRVITMMMGREGSMRTYPEINVSDPHHPLTHHRGNADWIEKVSQINTLHMELFSGFVEKLKSTPDGDGSLLDHSMIVYGSGLADGNRHTHEDLPVLIVGRGGNLRRGTHVVYPKDTPMTNLFLTLLDQVGVHAGEARRQYRSGAASDGSLAGQVPASGLGLEARSLFPARSRELIAHGFELLAQLRDPF